MSWLLFLDESGHDHRSTPYEVRGGLALHASQLWPLVQAIQRLELDCYGTRLNLFGKEIKGSTLVDAKRFRFAAQGPVMPDEARRKHAREFLAKGLQRTKPTREGFTAYGQACLAMARGLMQLLSDHDAILFAAVIPRDVSRPTTFQAEQFLRKDHVFLLERFFYLLEERQEHGILVMDEVDRAEDSRLVRRIEAYFTNTGPGQYRTTWIVPTPFFVSSEMTYPVQAADLCIYCINWGFRLPRGMDAEAREEIAREFGPWLNRLQYRGQGQRDGHVFETYGIVFVPDPYVSR